MPVTQFPAGSAQPDRSSTPPSQAMGLLSFPAGATAKSEFRCRLPNPLPLGGSTRSPRDDSSACGHHDGLPVLHDPAAAKTSLTEPETADFLVVPPFHASQIQMILWFSWTTTATATQIAEMHNHAFHDFPHKMSRWDVMDIENDIATSWHESGGFLKGTKAIPLILPPGYDNPWCCLCDFGVENCWDYKRDQESGENLEKLTMARMLWDATPKQMVRCPHGRRKPTAGSCPPTTPSKPPMLHRLQALRSRIQTLHAWLLRWFMTIIESLFTAYFIYAVVIVATEGWGSPLTTEFLFYALMVGTIFVATPCIGIEVAITLHVIALCFLLMINPEIPARLEENTFQADTLPRLVAGILLHIFRPFMPPRTMTALLVCFGTLWICLVLATMLDIDLDMTSLLGLATLSVVVWRSWEDDGVKAWRDSPRRFEV